MKRVHLIEDFIYEKGKKPESVAKKVKKLNKKIKKAVAKKEDLMKKSKEIEREQKKGDAQPSDKLQKLLLKSQIKTAGIDAQKTQAKQQQLILKKKVKTAKDSEKSKKELTKENLLDREDLLENTINQTMKQFHEQLDREALQEAYTLDDVYDLIANHRFKKDFKKLSAKDQEWVVADASERGFNESLLESDVYSLIDELYEAKPGPDPYHRGLDDEDVEDKEDQIKKQADMDDDDPGAYKEMPGDKEARKKGEVKTSKATKKYSELYGDEENESVEISEKAKPYAFAIADWFNAVEKAGNFENIGKELKAAGYEFEFEDNKNNPAYKVGHDGATFAIANKKYWGRQYRAIEKKIGDIAIGWVFPNDTYNESNINEEKAEGDRGPIGDDKIETALKKKAKDTGVPIDIIRIIMRRGMAAWKSGHRPGATQQMWGYARVNAFLTKGDGTWGGADKDVAKEVRDGGHDKGLKESLLTEEETYNDYPAAAKKNAKKAIDWKEEHGRDEVDAGTAVGWARAHQLAKGEKLSVDTVKRMASFNRHRKNSSIKPELKGTPWKDKGYVSWLIWGGDEGVDWAIKKSEEIDALEETNQMKYIKPIIINEGYWSKLDYNQWVKQNGKVKFPKWIKSTMNEIIQNGFMDKVYDSEHWYMTLWLSSFDTNTRSELYAYDNKGTKEFGRIGYSLIQRFWNDLTGYTMISFQAALAALEVSKHIRDMEANGESIEPAYYLMKEYFNNFNMQTNRNRVFDSAIKKLEVWMEDNEIQTL